MIAVRADARGASRSALRPLLPYRILNDVSSVTMTAASRGSIASDAAKAFSSAARASSSNVTRGVTVAPRMAVLASAITRSMAPPSRPMAIASATMASTSGPRPIAS